MISEELKDGFGQKLICCPYCGNKDLVVIDMHLVGKVIRCNTCKRVFKVTGLGKMTDTQVEEQASMIEESRKWWKDVSDTILSVSQKSKGEP